jgi:ATPase family AAA domain-containing protein 3A/B
MFGGSGRRKKEAESLSAAMAPENAPSSSGKNSVTGFDPEGLERAAKAARDLDNSRNAAAAIDLVKTQEATKQVHSVIGFGRTRRLVVKHALTKDRCCWPL